MGHLQGLLATTIGEAMGKWQQLEKEKGKRKKVKSVGAGLDSRVRANDGMMPKVPCARDRGFGSCYET
jgi:hypothetical protein